MVLVTKFVDLKSLCITCTVQIMKYLTGEQIFAIIKLNYML